MLTSEFKRKSLEKLEDCTAEQMVSTLEKIGSVKMTKEEQWVTKAVTLLKQLEFSATEVNMWVKPNTYHVCPICQAMDDHEDSCELNELLKEAEEII